MFANSTMSKVPALNASANEWVRSRTDNIRPWSVFLDVKLFSTPQSFSTCTARVVRNVEYFQSNYIIVFIGLIVYCILTSPLLLVAVATLLGSCYIIKLKNESKELNVLGHKLSVAHQYALVSIISFPLFYIAGAGSIVFWILGASFFIIMLHATLYSGEPKPYEEETFDLQMEPV